MSLGDVAFRPVTYGGTTNLFRESIETVTWSEGLQLCNRCFFGLADFQNAHVQVSINVDRNVQVWIGSYFRGNVTRNLVWFVGTGQINVVMGGLRHALCNTV